MIFLWKEMFGLNELIDSYGGNFMVESLDHIIITHKFSRTISSNLEVYGICEVGTAVQFPLVSRETAHLNIRIDDNPPIVSAIIDPVTETSMTIKVVSIIEANLHGVPYKYSGGSTTDWTTATSHKFENLDPNTTYTLTVTARDLAGNEGSDSNSDVTLPVELTSFTATAGDGKVTLHWITESEIENLGFNIYRSTNSNVKFLMLNDELIPGAGSSSSRHGYEYIDKGLTNEVTYWYKLEDVDYSGKTELHGPISATPMAKAIPTEFRLRPNYPNPFNPTTTISYELPKSSFIRLSVYDISGRLVETLVHEQKDAGYYSVEWNVEKISSGIYFYKIEAGEFSDVKKCLVVK